MSDPASSFCCLLAVTRTHQLGMSCLKQRLDAPCVRHLVKPGPVTPPLLHRLAPGGPGGPGLPAAAAADRDLLVPVLSSHLLLLRQLPLLPRTLLLPASA